MNEARLPFTMKATVTYGGAPREPLPAQLLPGWVRIPVSFQVTLPAEAMEHARQGGSSAGSGHGPVASVSIVPHSLRVGAGGHPVGGRTWKDFDALLTELQDDPASPASAQVSQEELAAALRGERHPVLPVPPQLGLPAPPIPRDFDAFLDFMDDPERHPLAASPVSISHAPGPGKSAMLPPIQTINGSGRSTTTGAAANVGQKAAAAAEIGLGATMTAVGTGATALGVATSPARRWRSHRSWRASDSRRRDRRLRRRAQALEPERQRSHDTACRSAASVTPARAACRATSDRRLLDGPQGGTTAQPDHNAYAADAEERRAGGRAAAWADYSHHLWRHEAAGRDKSRRSKQA